ncbi:MBL fold metallo-hydrolase [Candidatus Woesearchaeota archaeon]|nr:MBL fold metallo-hydrolase [Candidatus Woesearchaeota archaeon]
MELLDGIKWLGHASFAIKDVKTIVIDPYELKEAPKADIVLITHDHFDHCSPKDLKEVLKDDTIVVSIPGCAEKLVDKSRLRTVKPGQEIKVEGIRIRTIPAYNVRPERLSYHPRGNEGVGYIIDLPGRRIYHAGDTDFIEEMKQLKDIDVAMLPIGGTYTMDVNEAAEAANAIKAKVTVPMHYRKWLKDKSKDAEELFRSKVRGEVAVID